MFGISDQFSTILSIPATYATAFGFIFSYGKMMSAMSQSKLLPAIFHARHPRTGTHYVSIIAGSALSFVVCIVVYVVPFVGLHMFDICIFSAFMAYLSQCVGYVYMQTKFQNISREFRSPLGVYGAVYSGVVWALCAVTVLGFSSSPVFVLSVLAGQFVLLSA